MANFMTLNSSYCTDSPKLDSVKVRLSLLLKAMAYQHTQVVSWRMIHLKTSAFLSTVGLSDPSCPAAPASIGSPLKTLASRLLALLKFPQLKQRVDHLSICTTRKYTISMLGLYGQG